VVPFPGAEEAAARRRREAEARAAADADARRRRREAEAVRARERREAEMYAAAAEAEARRRREAEVRAALNAAALATSVAAKDAGVWASRASKGRSAVREEAHRRARVTKPSDVGGDHAAYVDAYVAAVTGAFEDAEARAADRAAAAAAARVAHDAAVDRDNAAAAVISAFVDEAVVACRREAAAAALAEAETANRKLTEIAGEILMLVDAHGGLTSTSSLPFVYQKWYGKDLDYPGKLTTFLGQLPGVELIPGPSATLGAWIRRATALAPTTNPRVAADVARILQGPAAEPQSRSASPDPTAAIWTPAAAPGFDPHPGMYSYPPPAYSYPSVPVGAYVIPPPQPVPLLPAPLLNPFVLQPVPEASRSRNRGQKKGKKEVCLSEFVVESCVYYGCVPWDRSRSCSGQNGFSTASRLPTRREGYAIQLAYLIALMRRMTRWASMSPHTPITQRLSVGK